MPTKLGRNRTCPACDATFVARHLRQKYCRPRCKDRTNKQFSRTSTKKKSEERELLASRKIMEPITLSPAQDRIRGRLLDTSNELKRLRTALGDDWDSFHERTLKEYRMLFYADEGN